MNYTELYSMFKEAAGAAGVMPANPAKPAGAGAGINPMPKPMPQNTPPAPPDPAAEQNKARLQGLQAFLKSVDGGNSAPQGAPAPQAAGMPRPVPNTQTIKPMAAAAPKPGPVLPKMASYTDLCALVKQAEEEAGTKGKGASLLETLLMAGLVTPITTVGGALIGMDRALWNNLFHKNKKSVLHETGRGAAGGAGLGLGGTAGWAIDTHLPEDTSWRGYPTGIGAVLGHLGGTTLYDWAANKRNQKKSASINYVDTCNLIKQAAGENLPNLAGQGTGAWDNNPEWQKWNAPGTYSPGAGYFSDFHRRGGYEAPQQDPSTSLNIPPTGQPGPSGGAKAINVPQGVSSQVWSDVKKIPGVYADELSREWNDAKRFTGGVYNAMSDYVGSGNMAADIGTGLGTAYKTVTDIPGKVRAYLDDVNNSVGQATGKQIGAGVNAFQRAAHTAPKITAPANGPYTMADRSPEDNLNVSAVENQRWDVPFTQQVSRIGNNMAPTPAANGPYAPMDRSPEDMANARSAQRRYDAGQLFNTATSRVINGFPGVNKISPVPLPSLSKAPIGGVFGRSLLNNQ